MISEFLALTEIDRAITDATPARRIMFAHSTHDTLVSEAVSTYMRLDGRLFSDWRSFVAFQVYNGAQYMTATEIRMQGYELVRKLEKLNQLIMEPMIDKCTEILNRRTSPPKFREWVDL